MKIRSFLISLILIIALSGCGQNAELKEKSVKVEQHLKEKYGKEFVVSSTEYYSRSLGGSVQTRSAVHPKDNSKLSFFIYSTPGVDEFREFVGDDGQDMPGSHLGVIWSKDFRQEVGELINEVYPEKPDFCATVDLEYPLAGKMWGSSPTYSKFIEKYPEDADKLEYDIEIIIFEDLDEAKKIEQAEKAFELFTLLKDKKITSFALGFDYFESNSKNDVKKIIKHNGIEKLISICLYEPKEYSTFKYRLLVKNDGSVKSYSDILKSFVVKNK